MRIGVAAILLLLAGCALLPSGFDSIEHSYLVTINQLSADVKVCDDTAHAVMTSQQILTQARWVQRYGASLPRNSRLTEMEQNLVDMSQELWERYQRGGVSAVYCRSKLVNIHRATEAIIDISGQRPRL
jgi:hypothetical protein